MPTTDEISGVVPHDLLEQIRNENLNVYRASPDRLREDIGQESQIAQDYRGRLVYELLQNADDAMAGGNGDTCIRFELTDLDLWVANSGRPLDEDDIRGLCGISASKKSKQRTKRRASIGHKGMGFKSVLEISAEPEVFSTSLCFRFSPAAAVQSVQQLVTERKFQDSIRRAPTTRFPWPATPDVPGWEQLLRRGMNTAFRLPLGDKMTGEQRDVLASTLRDLPITALIFLKHIGRIEVDIKRSTENRSFAWTVLRQRHVGQKWTDVAGFDESGEYRVTLASDNGEAETFFLALDADIAIGDHRGGLDEFTWEGVEFTEVSVAAYLQGDRLAEIPNAWRRFHVFLPTGEPCPYGLLVSGAFCSNLSRKEIRIENDSNNYNRFLFRQAARVLKNSLLHTLLADGVAVQDCLRLLDRRMELRAECSTAPAQTFYTEVIAALNDFQFLPAENGAMLAIRDCAVPPIVSDEDMGRSFKLLLKTETRIENRQLPRAELCRASVGRVLVDHGAHELTPEEAVSLLADADPSASALEVHKSNKVFVDPVLNVLERLWRGLNESGKERLTATARNEPIFPVAIVDNTTRRISTGAVYCFYPPRSLHGEVPLDNLCFLLQELCWWDLTPRDRNEVLHRQMEAWKALFDIRDFKFPEVMRASVLPALDLESDSLGRSDRARLHNVDCLAAICQLAGRTPNEKAPLPYERLKTNRALFNLSRLDVPCRGAKDGEVKWVPAYRAYFGIDWIGSDSVEIIITTGRTLELAGLPAMDFLVGPDRFTGLLARYRHMQEDHEATGEDAEAEDIGADEVGLEEDEEVALDANDRTLWFRFFQWLGVNASLRPVHFHDVEDRASGWLKTRELARPEGWAFQNIPEEFWSRYRAGVLEKLEDRNPKRNATTVPYFYELHDLEHLVALLNIAKDERTAKLARALYEHLARHWATLEQYSRVIVAQVDAKNEPTRRTKPPRARGDELVYAGVNLWLHRLHEGVFCPTGHGPRSAASTWLPTAEVQRRFGRRGRTDSYLIPTLEVGADVLQGRAKTFALALGVRDELSPATFSIGDAHALLDRLYVLYDAKCSAGEDLRMALREVIRPAYRNLIELLPSKMGEDIGGAPLGNSMALAVDGRGNLRFSEARNVFYLDRRDTRDRLTADSTIQTFVIEALPSARSVMMPYFGMRTLENSLAWSPEPGDAALSGEQLIRFRDGLRRLAPFLLARVATDHADERTARTDARNLRRFIDAVEPVVSLNLRCKLDDQEMAVGERCRESFVDLDGNGAQAFVIWSENPWPPSPHEAETLASAFCDVLGAGYFESFIVLMQYESSEDRREILRRAGAPVDIEEKEALYQAAGGDKYWEETAPSPVGKDEPKTTVSLPGNREEPAPGPSAGDDVGKRTTGGPRTPLYKPSDLLIEGEPLLIQGDTGVEGGGRGPGASPRGSKGGPGNGNGDYGGRTDLDELDALGMWIALSFEQRRLRRVGLENAVVFGASPDTDGQALVFDVSNPEMVESARSKSNLFHVAMQWLHKNYGVVPDWPGFDILTLNPDIPDRVDRMIELKSSGIASRVQEMTWNEWKTAKESILRERFYLYLVGNLRSDLIEARPYIRTIRNPFEQIMANVQVAHAVQKKVQLFVHSFSEAEHLDLTVH